MITISRRIQFCSGHRVYKHESKCSNLHGHNYVCYIKATAPELDTLGRIIDFSVLKEKVGGWIDCFWDHGFIWFVEDPMCHEIFTGQINGTPSTMKNYVMEVNPTAENMAKHLLNVICPGLMEDTGVTVTEITLWETENCEATVSLDA